LDIEMALLTEGRHVFAASSMNIALLPEGKLGYRE